MEYYNEKQQQDIIAKAREIAKTFPEKKNKNQEEILDLIGEIDWYDKARQGADEHNSKLEALYEEIRPIIEKVEAAASVISESQWELSRFIDKIYEEKASKEWAEEKGTIDANRDFSYTETFRTIREKEKLQEKGTISKAQVIKKVLTSSYSRYNRDEQGWMRSPNINQNEIANKLTTRLNKLNKKTTTEQFYSIKTEK